MVSLHLVSDRSAKLASWMHSSNTNQSSENARKHAAYKLDMNC